MIEPYSRRGIAAPMPGSPTTWGSGSKRSTKIRPSSVTRLCDTSPGTMTVQSRDRGRTRYRAGAPGDQRVSSWRAAATARAGRARQRWLDRLRVLAVLRYFPGGADEPRPREGAATAWDIGLWRVGLGVAGESPHPVQPRVGRSPGPAVVRAQEARLVGRNGATVDRL